MRKRPRPDQIAAILRDFQADLDAGLNIGQACGEENRDILVLRLISTAIKQNVPVFDPCFRPLSSKQATGTIEQDGDASKDEHLELLPHACRSRE